MANDEPRALPGRDEESELLVAAGRGDLDALRLLYRAFERPLFSLGLRWLGDPGLAEELVQEVTVRIWRHARNYDPARAAAGSWIFGVARNVALDLDRGQRRRPVPVEQPLPDKAVSHDEEAAWEAWQVARAVGELPPDQRRVVELAYGEHLTHSEIAARLGIPLGTVKTRLYAALKVLRVRLAELGVLAGESAEGTGS